MNIVSNLSVSSTNSFDDSFDDLSESAEQSVADSFPFQPSQPNHFKKSFEIPKQILSSRKCKRPLLYFPGMHKKDGFLRKSCDNLICTSCDVPIRAIADSKWAGQPPDYLFIRSYFGNQRRMRSRVSVEKGAIILHCGCRSVELRKPCFANELMSGPKWICSGCPQELVNRR